MPSVDRFTNAPGFRRGVVLQPPRGSRPYVSQPYGNKILPLTAKEREARRQSRLFGSAISKSASFGIDPVMGSNTVMSGTSSFFSPQLSTDFLQLPQTIREKREIYRHFYNTDEIVAQSIDLHTELPLSKVRLAAPKPSTHPKGFESSEDYGKYILSFFQRMEKRIKLFQKLIMAVHHLWLDGCAAIFAEDSDVQIPPEVGYREQMVQKNVLTDDGEAKEEKEKGYVEKDNREDEELEYYQKHYQGWERLIIFPIDQVKTTTFSFSDRVRVELIPSERDRALLEQAKLGDPLAEEMAAEMPDEVREYIGQGRLIPLGTDPDEGSFCFMLSARKQAGEEIGQSILDRCHIAGTPILVKRDGVVQHVPIEDLDPDRDLALTHTGAWREFEVGVRRVSEEITLLNVAKIESPVGCTSDHKYPVLRDGTLIDTTASDVCAGDYLQIAQVPLPESIRRIDLADFIDGTVDAYRARRSGRQSDLIMEVFEKTDESFGLRYDKDQTDPRRLGRVGDVNAILDWASTLTEPVKMRSAEVCERFGIHPVTLKEIRAQLVTLGYGVSITKDKSIIFPPNASDVRVPTTRPHVRSFPRFLDLDTGLGYLLGFWLGDGHVARQAGLDYGCVGFTYGPHEAASLASIEHEIKPTLDRLNVRWTETPTGAGVHLSGLQDVLVRWIAVNFGHTCEDKHLPGWIFDAPRDFLLALLRGFVDSDGDVVLKSHGGVSVRFNGTNGVLLDQVFLLCTSLNIPVSKTKPTPSRWVRQANGTMAWAKPSYAVHFTHGPSIAAFFESGFLAKRKEPAAWKDGRSGSRHVAVDGKLFYRVSDVSRAMHEGPVYSLNVHADHSFFAGVTRTYNCLRTLYYREKLRQAQTQIADRAMTPKRIVWAEDISDADVDDLREQVDLSLVDPDYSIVANYEIHWEEMGSKDRLLDLSGEYEQTERRLRTGLGVTEALLSGETLYSGDRLKLEVINQRYLFLREILQEYVDEYLFRPVARRKGFVEKDRWGEEVVLYPHLSFTRLPLRDSQDTYDALFNLYQKGSISIDLILEMFNIDPDDTSRKIKQDMFTVNDAIFNEMTRGIYSAVAQQIVESTDIGQKMADYLGLKPKPKENDPSDNRFG